MSHWQSRAKIRPADTLWTNYLRSKSIWRCDRCKKDCSDNHHNLTTSHYHGRRKESTRFDEDNCDVLCRKCHEWAESHKKTEYKEWKIKKLGQRKFDLLEIRANTYKKRDDVMNLLIIKQLFKDLDS